MGAAGDRAGRGLRRLRSPHRLSTRHLNDLANLFKALSDPSRLAIFQRIRDCCCECHVGDGDLDNTPSKIARCFDLSMSTVSHHMKELRNAGLIICERRGQRVYCRVNEEAVARIEAFTQVEVDA